LAAVVALAACSQEDVIIADKGAAIGFDTFVENSTRVAADPSYSNTNLFDDFRVYGFVEGATLFNGTLVSGTGLGENGNWTYEGTQYWIAGANYVFHAVAPASNNMTNVASTAANGVSFTYTNVSGEEDMLYAYAEETGDVRGNKAVEFAFSHILSKVKFTFTNGYNASNATIKVKDVVITNAHNTANVALKYDATNKVKSVAWTGNNGTISAGVKFGSAVAQRVDDVKVDGVLIPNHTYNTKYESDYERFVIPSTAYEYIVTFTVELYINGVQIDVDKDTDGVQGYNHTAEVTFAPQAGNAYNICTTITHANIDPNNEQEPIEFTVTTIGDWGNYRDVNMPEEDENN
jgi:hypothetical protein